MQIFEYISNAPCRRPASLLTLTVVMGAFCLMGCSNDSTAPMPKDAPAATEKSAGAPTPPPGVENRLPPDVRQKIQNDPNAPQALKDRLKGGERAPQ